MANIFLDLSVFCERTLDIKMPSGEIVHIKKPTQKMFIDFLAYRSGTDAGPSEIDAKKVIDALDGIILEILNNNTEKRAFSRADLENLTLGMKKAVLEAFAKFVCETVSDPN